MNYRKFLMWTVLAIMCAIVLSVPLIGVASAADGDLLWSKTYDAASYTKYNSPTVDENGIVYLYPGSYDHLYAYYPNGTEKWAVDVGESDGCDATLDQNGIIYIGNRPGGFGTYTGYVKAFHPNGTQKWVTEQIKCIRLITVDENNNIYASSGYNHYKIDEDGNVLWNVTTPAGLPGTVYKTPTASNNNNVIYYTAYDEGIFALNMDTGALEWTYSNASDAMEFFSYVSISADESTVYSTVSGVWFGPGNETPICLIALDAVTGIEKWVYDTGDSDTSYGGTTVTSDGSILFFANGTMYRVNANGTLRWKSTDLLGVNDGEACITQLIDGSFIFAPGSDLYNVNATGTFSLIYDAPATTLQSVPAVASDGTIYYTGAQRLLYAIEGSTPPMYNYANYIAGNKPNNFDSWHNQYKTQTPVLTNVRILSTTTGSITIGWDLDAITDNVKVYRDTNTNLIGQSTSTSYTDTTVVSGKQYNYWLEPWDGAVSGSKYAISGTTDSTGGGMPIPTPTITPVPTPTPDDDSGQYHRYGNFSITVPDFWESPLWSIILFMVSSLMIVGYASEERK